MSFDIKYDKNGEPIKDKTTEQNIEAAPDQQEMSHTEAPTRDETSHVAEKTNQEVSEPESEIVSQEFIETPKERNMRILREAKESADKEKRIAMQERDEAIRRAEDLERRYKKPIQVEEDGDDLSLGEDDLAEGKHLKKVYKEVKELKKQVEYYKNNSQTQSTESRIRAEFPDFASVVTPDNITILRSLKPRQCAILDKSDDMYETAAVAYEMIKEHVLIPEDKYGSQKQMAQKNAIKPKPLVSLSPQQGDSPLSKANAFANGLTPELAAQLRKEMREASR